jgi:hypothetical protein
MLIKGKEVVMVVYAYKMYDINTASHPWIYGVYTDHTEGMSVQDEMQNSEDYGHLHWTNNLVELKV